MDNPETAIEQPITLFAKMARVMGEMKRIPKSGRNAHFGYPYAEESDIADIVREELAKEKIAFFPSIIRSEQVPFERVTKDGKKTTGISTHLWFQMTFACGDTGATFSCLWESESEDSQDKGINKAATAGVKYFLLKTFIISTGEKKDDPDSGLGKVAGRIDPARRQNEQRKVSGAPNPPPPQSKTPAQAEKRDAGVADETPTVEVIEANTAGGKPENYEQFEQAILGFTQKDEQRFHKALEATKSWRKGNAGWRSIAQENWPKALDALKQAFSQEQQLTF